MHEYSFHIDIDYHKLVFGVSHVFGGDLIKNVMLLPNDVIIAWWWLFCVRDVIRDVIIPWWEHVITIL